MKKHLIIIPALLFSILGFSQGIEFEHGTWKEVLEKAQQTNKPIFVDFYAQWCSPCRMMDKDIFPLEEVGKVFNANFVCYKVDSENGEGINLAKQYEVRFIPSYLFLRPDGSQFYRNSGSMNAKRFIAESGKALALMSDPKPINIWDKEYADKKNDPTFLLEYMEKRSKLGMTCLTLFNEYLELLSETERTSPVVIELYKKNAKDIRINAFAYTYLQKNIAAFEKAFGPDKAYVNYILSFGIKNSVDVAIAKKDEQLLANAAAAYDLLPKDEIAMVKAEIYTHFNYKDEIYMQYYLYTGEKEKYFKHVADFGNNNLMKITDEMIAKKDKANSQMVENRIKSGQIDATQLSNIRAYWKNKEKTTISWHLNNIASEVFKKVSDKQLLQDALSWSKRSLELSPNSATWMNTYANLLYKLGHKKEAIAKEEEVLRLISNKKNTQGYKDKAEILRKMRTGENIWNN